MVFTPNKASVSIQASKLAMAAASARQLKTLLEATVWKEGQSDPEWVTRDKSGKFSSGGGGSSGSSNKEDASSSSSSGESKSAGGSDRSVKERLRTLTKDGINTVKNLSKESREKVKAVAQKLGKEASRTAVDSLAEAHPAFADGFTAGISAGEESDNAGVAQNKVETAIKEKHGNGDLAKKVLLVAGAAILGHSALNAFIEAGGGAVALTKLVAHSGELKKAAKDVEKVAADFQKQANINIGVLEDTRKVKLGEVDKEVTRLKKEGAYSNRVKAEAEQTKQKIDSYIDDLIQQQKKEMQTLSNSLEDANKVVGLGAGILIGNTGTQGVRAFAEGAFAVGMVKSASTSKNQQSKDSSVQAASGDDVSAEAAVMNAVQAIFDRLRSKKVALFNPSNEELAALAGIEPRQISAALAGIGKDTFERELNSLRTQVGSFMTGLLDIQTKDPQQFLSQVQALSSIAEKVDGRSLSVKVLANAPVKISASSRSLNLLSANESVKQIKRLMQSAAWKEGQSDPEWVSRDKSGKFSSGEGSGESATSQKPTSDTPDIENPAKNKFLKKVLDAPGKLKSAIGARIKEAQHQSGLQTSTKNIAHGMNEFGKIAKDAAIAAESEAGLNLMNEGILDQSKTLEMALKAQLAASKKKIQEGIEKLKSNVSLDDPTDEQLMSFLGINPKNYQDSINSENATIAKQMMQEIKGSVKDAKKAMLDSDITSPESVIKGFAKSINHLAEADGSVKNLMEIIGQVDPEGKPTSPENAKLLRSKDWAV